MNSGYFKWRRKSGLIISETVLLRLWKNRIQMRDLFFERQFVLEKIFFFYHVQNSGFREVCTMLRTHNLQHMYVMLSSLLESGVPLMQALQTLKTKNRMVYKIDVWRWLPHRFQKSRHLERLFELRGAFREMTSIWLCFVKIVEALTPVFESWQIIMNW